MEQFLIQYGLLAILCCALIENDVTFVLTGVVIQLGKVDPILGVIYALAGAMFHDFMWFSLGRAKADSIRGSRIYRRVGPLVERLAENFGPWELFFCRFIYGTRNPSLVFWGVHGLAVPKFLIIDGLALTIWGTFLAGAGYFLSDRAAAIIGRVKSMERWLLGALLIVGIGLLAARLFTRYEIRKRLPPPDDNP